MTKLKVTNLQANLKLCDYIKVISPTLTITKIKKEINRGQVKVNGNKVKDNYLLQIGDELSIYLKIKKFNDQFLKNKLKIDIFYEDDNIIIFDKPKNVACQENENEKINTLNNYLKKYCYIKGYWDGYNDENEPALIHRLDQNTSGLILAGKNKHVVKILNQAINDQITKKYLTIIYGLPPKKSGILSDYIIKNEKQKNKMLVLKNKMPVACAIKTKYQLLFFNNQYSILSVELLTGKKHQIRAHLAFYKMYIVGDGKYGIKNKNLTINSQILISNKIIFNLKDKKLSYLNNKKFIKYQDPKILFDMVK